MVHVVGQDVVVDWEVDLEVAPLVPHVVVVEILVFL